MLLSEFNSSRHAKVIEIHEDDGMSVGEAKKSDYNFDVEDLKRLERITDLETLKTQALALISKPSAKPMKPEKVQWFKNALERMNSPLKVIKLMYDLMLSGEGNSVIGSRNSMNPNNYRQRFGEQDVSEDFGDSPVAGAITHRILSQRLDLLKQYGPELVGAAVDNVADYVGDVEEIGSSDVSAWVAQVERMLKENPPEAFAESSDNIKNKMSKLEALALAANRAGDDAKCKMYQQKIQSLKQKLSKNMSVAEDEPGGEAGDMRAAWMIKAAKRAFPLAKSDAEAIAMWLADKAGKDISRLDQENDQEQKDIDRLDRENDREDQEIDNLERANDRAQNLINHLNSISDKLNRKVDDLEKSTTWKENKDYYFSTKEGRDEVSKYLAEMKNDGYDI
jgi:hypothetical protein